MQNYIMLLGLLLVVVILIWVVRSIWDILLVQILHRRINRITETTERIKAMEKAFAKGYYRHMKEIYYINLSVCYHQTGDSEKALQLLGQAEFYKENKEGKTINIRKPSLSKHMIEINKAAYLIALRRWQEATEILDVLEQVEDKEVQNLVNYHRERVKEHEKEVIFSPNDAPAL
jgi:tetratricopeptide (TPR) repeat protein